MTSPETNGDAFAKSPRESASGSNPYQSPVLVWEDLAGTPKQGHKLLHEQDSKTIARGIGIAHVAAILTTITLLIPGCLALVSHNGMLYDAVRSLRIGVLSVLPTVFVIAIGVGAHWCNRVPGTHRSLCWLATLLFFIGGAGTSVSLARLIGGGTLLGMAPLFAASTFSAFLTGMALFALFFRVWSSRCGSKRSSLFFEGTVLCLAISGVMVSAAVVWPAFAFSTKALVANAGAFLLLPASCLLTAGLRCLRVDWRLFVDSASTDGGESTVAVE